MKITDMKVELVDHMGSDLSVVNAARVSFDKFHEVFEEGKDDKLIAYLAKHGHWTPFAHAFLSFRIKAPIFVARQLVKHQVGLAWNEVSRRYVNTEPEFWFPGIWRKRAENVKQGSSNEGVPFGPSQLNNIQGAVEATLMMYQMMLDNGVAPEQARMVLPQNTMTEWIWSGSLAAFARVCKLRLDPHAQAETKAVAEAIKGLAEPLFPVSFPVLIGEVNERPEVTAVKAVLN
jgi:thymidylate synthase (FAD)